MINDKLIQEHDPIFQASPSAGITNNDISNWNSKSDFSGSYNDLTNKPTIPTMDSSYGASTTNGYNKTYINSLDTYDTTERRIGTWNSSALYRKNITGTLNGTYIEDGFRFTWISSGLSNIVVRKMEYAINTTSNTYAGFSNDVSMQYVRTGGNANKVQVGVNNSSIPNTTTITIVLYYTKS